MKQAGGRQSKCNSLHLPPPQWAGPALLTANFIEQLHTDFFMSSTIAAQLKMSFSGQLWCNKSVCGIRNLLSPAEILSQEQDIFLSPRIPTCLTPAGGERSFYITWVGRKKCDLSWNEPALHTLTDSSAVWTFLEEMQRANLHIHQHTIFPTP